MEIVVKYYAIPKTFTDAVKMNEIFGSKQITELEYNSLDEYVFVFYPSLYDPPYDNAKTMQKKINAMFAELNVNYTIKQVIQEINEIVTIIQ